MSKAPTQWHCQMAGYSMWPTTPTTTTASWQRFTTRERPTMTPPRLHTILENTRFHPDLSHISRNPPSHTTHSQPTSKSHLLFDTTGCWWTPLVNGIGSQTINTHFHSVNSLLTGPSLKIAIEYTFSCTTYPPDVSQLCHIKVKIFFQNLIFSNQ